MFPPSESVDVARKALISRVVELTDERSALQRELTSVQETVARAEGRMKEKEDEAKRSGVVMIEVMMMVMVEFWFCGGAGQPKALDPTVCGPAQPPPPL